MNLTHLVVAVTAQPLRKYGVTTVLHIAAIDLALGLELAHQIVRAEFRSLHMCFCVIHEEKVLVLGVCLDPVSEVGGRHESVVGL